MQILGGNFFQISNIIFCYNLSPIQLAVYFYLVSTAGQKDKCWSSMNTIAVCCDCSKNAACAAVDELVRRGFIRKVATYMDDARGRTRQTNNTYYIQPLPEVAVRRNVFWKVIATNLPRLNLCMYSVW